MAQTRRRSGAYSRAKRVTLKDLVDKTGAPKILVANTYYWSGFYGNAEQRHRKALRYVKEVEEWLEHLNEKYELGLQIKVDEDIPEVVAYKDGGEVFYFSITSSRANVYKRQNVKPLLKLLKGKI